MTVNKDYYDGLKGREGEQMTDSEIVKAFRCCYLNEDLCEECPCFKDEKCTDIGDIYNIPKQIIDIINRQKAEIKKLMEHNEVLDANLRRFFAFRLCGKDPISEIKAEALKEFVQLLELDHSYIEEQIDAAGNRVEKCIIIFTTDEVDEIFEEVENLKMTYKRFESETKEE